MGSVSNVFSKRESDELGRLYTSRNLLIVQSRLHAPSYAGPGRWIIINTKTKKSYIATGLDVVPEIIKVLDLHCNIADPSKASDNALKEHDKKLLNLVDVGLLVNVEETELSFSDLYSEFVFDYPFKDYSTSDWREDDHRLMEQYGSVSQPPATEKRYEGQHYSLPDYCYETGIAALLEKVSGGNVDEKLSFALKFAFAKIGEIESSFMTCIKRTSPSGGARHPTECYIQLLQPFYGCASGTYYYESATHSLVEKSKQVNELPSDNLIAVISLFSVVERAMWRYRDTRAYRPLLLDVGHLLETFKLVCNAVGLEMSCQFPSYQEHCIEEWCTAPNFLDIHIYADKEAHIKREVDNRTVNHNVTTLIKSPYEEQNVTLLTNPFLYISPTKAGLVANILLPKNNSIVLQPDDFLILSHCTPSARGDRETTLNGIANACNTSKSRVLQLFDSGVLMPSAVGRIAYRTARYWAKYGWYLSLLKFLSFRSNVGGEKLFDSTSQPSLDNNALALLLTRQTCRAFSDAEISNNIISQILGHSYHEPSIDIYVMPYNINGLRTKLYKQIDGKLKDIGHPIERQEIAAATIGQPPSSSGAITFWLVSKIGRDAVDYEKQCIKLGCLAQRMIVAANQNGLGVFMTPALSEVETCQLLKIDDAVPKDLIMYLMCMGYRE